MIFSRTPAQRTEDRSERTAVAEPRRRVVAPDVDIWEQDHALVVTAEMPGCDQDSVDITLERGTLTIRGTPSGETPEGFTLVYREYEPVAYERSFALPDQIEREGVTAVVRHGVLTLTLPKAKAVQPRRIAVQAG